MKKMLIVLAAAAALVGCGEKDDGMRNYQPKKKTKSTEKKSTEKKSKAKG